MKYQVLPFAIKTLDPRGMRQLTFFFILFVHTNILACLEVYFIFIFFLAMSSLCRLILTPNFRCVYNSIFGVNSLICVLYDIVAELHSVECKVVIPFQTCFIEEFEELGHKIRTSFINWITVTLLSVWKNALICHTLNCISFLLGLLVREVGRTLVTCHCMWAVPATSPEK